MASEMLTNNLLAGLSGKGVNVTICDLAKYIASNGVLVTPYVGRTRGFIPLPGAAYGVDPKNMSDTGAGFYNSHVSSGHLNLIPQEDEAELGKLEKRLRRAVESKSLADIFMPVHVYDQLKEEFEEIRDEYFAKRDEIVAKWDLLVAEFEAGAREMLAGIEMPQENREKLLGDFMGEIPSKRDYSASFHMELKVKAFPAVNVTEGLSESVAADVKATWQEDVVSTALLSIEKQIGEGWSRLNKAMNTYVHTGRLAPVALKTITKFATDLAWKNVFRNPLLTRLEQTLNFLEDLPTEQAAERIENAIGLIYSYGVTNNLRLDMSVCHYNAADLKSIVKMAG